MKRLIVIVVCLIVIVIAAQQLNADAVDTSALLRARPAIRQRPGDRHGVSPECIEPAGQQRSHKR